MDTMTGRVGAYTDLVAGGSDPKNLVPVSLSGLSRSVQRRLAQQGVAQVLPRSRCPCGSGRRFKSCCMGRTRDAIERELKRRGRLA